MVLDRLIGCEVSVLQTYLSTAFLSGLTQPYSVSSRNCIPFENTILRNLLSTSSPEGYLLNIPALLCPCTCPPEACCFCFPVFLHFWSGPAEARSE